MSHSAPLACDITAIEDEDRPSHRQAAEDLFASVSKIRELPDGYGFRLPPQTSIIQQAGAFISHERLCCPFFHFALEVEPNRGSVWLDMTGREGVKQYLEDTVLPYWNLENDTEEPE